MEDKDIIDWIANHLTHLRVGLAEILEIEYIDDNGKPQWTKYISVSNESIPDMLRSAINGLSRGLINEKEEL